MHAVSQEYKEEMKKQLRDHSFIRVTIGVINQEAQASAIVPIPENYTYYSNLRHPLNNYEVSELYATCDQNYSAVDGSMYFLPRSREDVVLNAGIVSESLLGDIEVRFPVPSDLRGLTVEFGKAYPIDFAIESDHNTVSVTGNSSGHFVTEEIFPGATYIRLRPSTMVNGQGRFRVHQIAMGIGIYFDNRKILSATKKEYISPIMEELPTIDFDLSVNNKDRAFDIENEKSTVNFLEIGQDVTVLYGQELDDGSVEWMPGATVQLRSWSADDNQMKFTASDRFDNMDSTYYRGQYYADGISLYDLVLDVMNDAGIDNRTYWIDGYLKDVSVCNPIPVVSHKEALQLIANAGRCVLYQDREGKLIFKSSFVPEMWASSLNETYFSHAGSILDGTVKDEYSMAGKDYTRDTPTQYFLPDQDGTIFLNTGYISDVVADFAGDFEQDPMIEIKLEARYKCFGITLEFGRNHPEEIILRVFLGPELAEEYKVLNLDQVTVINHEFPEFDRLELEITKGNPHNRVILDNIIFGESTDYSFDYGSELTKTPNGTQLPKVRELQVIRTMYAPSLEEAKELAKETIAVTAADSQYTFYLSRATYDISASIVSPASGQTISIIGFGSFFVTVQIGGSYGNCEVVITGKEYTVLQSRVNRQLSPTGQLEIWENPLVSSSSHAVDLARWIGDYMRSDREYDLQYRGDPRIDGNDLAFLENKYVPNLLLRVYDHTLKFNGALSGAVKARRDMGYVATAKNRLAGK